MVYDHTALDTYLLFGTGWAFILSPSLSAAIASVPSESGGVAAGMIGTFHNFGGAMGLTFGTLIFSGAAYSNLLETVTNMHTPFGAWIADATANIDRAVAIITSNTSIDHSVATQLFQQFFLHGYSDAMWLLVLLLLASLCFVLLNFREKEVDIEKYNNKLAKGLH